MVADQLPFQLAVEQQKIALPPDESMQPIALLSFALDQK